MRNEQDVSSSFDLFLDTICNTFGGVVFLAILLAIMIQGRAVVKTIDSDGSHATPDQVRAAIAELESLSVKNEQIEVSLAGLPEPKSSIDDSEYRDRISQQKELIVQAEAELESETAAIQNLAKALEANAMLRQENEAVPAELEEAKKLVTKLRADYRSLAEAKQQSLQVPRIRSSNLASVLVLIQNGEFYLARTPSLFGTGFNEQQVSTTNLADTGIRIEPIVGSGQLVDTPQGESGFRRIVLDARSNNHAITIAIWSDSYDDFGNLSRMMVDNNVLYQLWPQSTGETLTVYLGSGSPKVQ